MDINECRALLESWNGASFSEYRKLKGITVRLGEKRSIWFRHIQGSPGAAPASFVVLRLSKPESAIVEWAIKSPSRLLGCMDFLLRVFGNTVAECSQHARGEDGSGSYQVSKLPQQVLPRNAVHVARERVEIAFRMSLPGTSRPPQILGHEAADMLSELESIAESIESAMRFDQGLRAHCEAIEDAEAVRRQLVELDLAAFVADGSMLPRKSGVSDEPAPRDNLMPFRSPDSLARHLTLPNKGQVRGMAIPVGLTVVIGGGFHGKTTLLNALAKGVYLHIPGDGRELVLTRADAVMLRSEDGRSVRATDISPFIRELPSMTDPGRFCTDNASGSTSQAAGLVEAVCAGAKVLLLDEDTSATNFLIKDPVMRRLVPDDPITPLVQHAKNLHKDHGVSTIVVVGGSSEYLGVADTVIRMHNYIAEDATHEVRSLQIPSPPQAHSFQCKDWRIVMQENFSPAFDAERHGKHVEARIKPLRGEYRVLEYGNDMIDLRSLDALVDETQTLTIGYLLLAAHRQHRIGVSPSNLAQDLCNWIRETGLDVLNDLGIEIPQLFAEPRVSEVAAAINRLRSLKTGIG